MTFGRITHVFPDIQTPIAFPEMPTAATSDADDVAADDGAVEDRITMVLVLLSMMLIMLVFVIVILK